MTTYVLKRVFAIFPMLVGISLLLFFVMNILPGGPEAMFVGENFDLATVAAVRQNLGLSQPIPVRYFKWVAAALQGDLGRSFRDGQPVLGQILARLPATVELTGSALILALSVALFTGIVSSVHPYSWADRLVGPFEVT